MHFFRFLSFLGFILLITSCSGYNRIVKSDDYDLKLQRAEELFDERSFNRALVLYEQVYQRFPKDEKGEVSYFKMGKTYYELEDFYMSGYYFSNFIQRFPSSKKVEESLYYSAMSSVQNSPSKALDQKETETAIVELQYFVTRFPDSRLVDSCNAIMDRLRGKLELKALDAVKLYDRMERFNAAKTSAMNFLEEYPRSEHKVDVAYIMIMNSSKLAHRSVFSKKKERLEDVSTLYNKYRDDLQISRYTSKLMLEVEKAEQELIRVDEVVMYEQITSMYARAQAASKTKKMEYLEETLKLYYNFAQRYPSSSYLRQAEEIYMRAERERSSTYSY